MKSHWLKTLLLSAISLVAVSAAAQTVNVTDAYVRGMPPGRTVTAAFFEIQNVGQKSCHLISATTDIAKRAELHTHLHEDGVMKMREVPSVEIPGEQTVSFEPGGLHIMLFGTRALKDREKVDMQLLFSDCEPLTVVARVRSARR